MANTLAFDQISTILAEIVSQATGSKVLAPIDGSQFVTVAQVGLKAGYDPLMTAISQVLSRTIFSVRPYSAKFKGLRVDAQRYGNMTRKLQAIDKPFEDDQRFDLVDGESIDQYKVLKPEVLQTNFYGAQTFQKHLTIYRDQLDSAFNSASEFGQFITMIMTNASDQIEQANEDIARMALNNFIVGKTLADTDSTFYLLDEYNALTGLTLTEQTVYQPDNYSAFIRWAYARIQTVRGLMAERSLKFHVNITDKPIMRHSPYERHLLFMLSSTSNQIASSVFSDVFNDSYIPRPTYETVNFWQSINDVDKINMKPVYLGTDGNLITGANTELSNVFAIVVDDEAVGETTVNEWSANSPFNAAGGYTNIFWHFTKKWWNDFTENSAVFLLTKPSP